LKALAVPMNMAAETVAKKDLLESMAVTIQVQR
jgi:hypothetical protein